MREHANSDFHEGGGVASQDVNLSGKGTIIGGSELRGGFIGYKEGHDALALSGDGLTCTVAPRHVLGTHGSETASTYCTNGALQQEWQAGKPDPDRRNQWLGRILIGFGGFLWAPATSRNARHRFDLFSGQCEAASQVGTSKARFGREDSRMHAAPGKRCFADFEQ